MDRSHFIACSFMENSIGLKRVKLEQYLPQCHGPLNLLTKSLPLKFQDLDEISVFSETKGALIWVLWELIRVLWVLIWVLPKQLGQGFC